MLTPRELSLGSLGVVCFFLTPALARNSYPILPPYILHARTVD